MKILKKIYILILVKAKLMVFDFLRGEKKTEENLYSRYLFSWNNIPGKDDGKLIDFLKQSFGEEWKNTIKIEKSDDTIKIDSKINSALLELNDTKTEAHLTVNDICNTILQAEKKDGKLNIYQSKHPYVQESVLKLWSYKIGIDVTDIALSPDGLYVAVGSGGDFSTAQVYFLNRDGDLLWNSYADDNYDRHEGEPSVNFISENLLDISTSSGMLDRTYNHYFLNENGEFQFDDFKCPLSKYSERRVKPPIKCFCPDRKILFSDNEGKYLGEFLANECPYRITISSKAPYMALLYREADRKGRVELYLLQTEELRNIYNQIV